MSEFTFIDLFAGIGGMRQAFESAGGRCVFSSEINKWAQKTYKDNFGEEPFGDIRSIAPEDIPDHDVTVAGFPCQAFSIAGVSSLKSRNRPHGFMDKTRGTLFFDVANIIRAKRPKAFFLENVKNLVSHDKGRTFATIKGTLQELGYSVYSKVIDAQLLVPQRRRRIYIIGFREPTYFEFPNIENKAPKLKDVLESDVAERYTISDASLRCMERHAQRHKERGNGFGFGLADPNGVSRTLLARYYKDGADILIPQPGKNPRKLTPRECARLMGFPDTFKITVSECQAYKQFGNSVVVPVVGVLAKALAACLNGQEVEWNLRAPDE